MPGCVTRERHHLLKKAANLAACAPATSADERSNLLPVHMASVLQTEAGHDAGARVAKVGDCKDNAPVLVPSVSKTAVAHAACSHTTTVEDFSGSSCLCLCHQCRKQLKHMLPVLMSSE